MRKKEISSDNLEDIEQSGRQCVLKIIVILVQLYIVYISPWVMFESSWGQSFLLFRDCVGYFN